MRGNDCVRSVNYERKQEEKCVAHLECELTCITNRTHNLTTDRDKLDK